MQAFRQRAFAGRQGVSAGTSRRVLVCVAKESRIGRAPVPIAKGVEVKLNGNSLKVKGPLGTLERTFHETVKIEQVDGKLVVKKADESRVAAQQHGLTRTLVSNMVTGVAAGFTKKMEMVGTGYRAAVAGKELTLNVGYSKPRVLPIPEGVKVTVEKNTMLTVSGADKVAVGDFCATIRLQRPPEPYKGKGVRYEGEVIKLKEGKAAGGKKK